MAEGLLREGLHVAEVADGFEKASRKVVHAHLTLDVAVCFLQGKGSEKVCI